MYKKEVMAQKYQNTYYLADWLAGKISDDDLKKLISESDYKQYLKIREASDLMAYFENTDFSIPERIRNNYRKKQSIQSKKNHRRVWLGIAASLILLFGLYRAFTFNTEIMIKTGIGETKKVALLDGSEVILNANSALTYSKKQWANNREVFLKGEAFFKVKKGSDFIVKTNQGQVKVLGTEFDVKVLSDLFQVVCFSGKVWVKSSEIDTVLTAGKAVKSSGQTIQHWSLATSQPDWLSGENSYKETLLKYVLNDLENQYKIRFDRSHIDDTIKFTGSFPHHDLQKALASVFKTLGIKFTVKNNLIILKK